MTDLGLIQASEDPQRDSVAIPHFLIVDGQITVGQVGGLVEGFLCVAYSNKYLLLDKESPCLGMDNDVTAPTWSAKKVSRWVPLEMRQPEAFIKFVFSR